MILEKGLENFQVLQRGADDRAGVRASGACDKAASGGVFAKVADESKSGNVILEQKVGSAKSGKWSAQVKGIPIGGNYKIEFSIRRRNDVICRLEKNHILVGDLWVLAGQSNMAGSSQSRIETPSPFVHSFDLADRWVLAEEPLFWTYEAVDPCYYLPQMDAVGMLPEPSRKECKKLAAESRATFSGGGGLGLTFAKEIHKAAGVPLGLVPAARGGTQMAEWSPSYKHRGGTSLYEALVRRVKAVGGNVKGVLWYQGESDTFKGRGQKYESALRDFIASVRSDVGQSDLPVLFVQLCRALVMGNLFEWNLVQDIQGRIGETIPDTGVVASIDLSLVDAIHLNAKSQMRLGWRLANLARRMVYNDTSVETGPKLKRIYALDDSHLKIAVEYSNVNGKLLPESRIAGFSVWEGLTKCESICEAAVDEKNPHRVILNLAEPLPEGGAVAYGFGTDPYCNLVDEADMAALTFLPKEVKINRKKR